MLRVTQLLVCVGTLSGAVVARHDSIDDTRIGSAIGKEDASIVRIGMTINSISDVDFRHSTFKASVTLTIVLEKSRRPTGSSVVRHDQYQYPFSDLQVSSIQARSRDSYRLITTAKDGTTTSTARYELDMFCPFNLKGYPFDVHRCDIAVFAARHSIKQLALSWMHSESVRLDPLASPSNVQVTLLASEDCHFEATYAMTEYNAALARFGCVRTALRFSRPLVTVLVRIFLPTATSVLITWIAAYIDRSQVHTRITTIAFSALLLFLLAASSNTDIPTTVYFTAADYWIVICSAFIFLSFLEVIVVHILMKMSSKHLKLASRDETIRLESRYRHEKQAAKRGRSTSPRPPTANGRIFEKKHVEVDMMGSTSTSNYDVLISEYFRRWADYYSVSAARVELTARIALPTTFFVVSALYFILFACL